MSLTGKMERLGGIAYFLPNNIVVDKTDYYVSYNNHDVSIYGCDTTALVVGQSRFYILDGNHTEKYKGFTTLEECLKYFNDNQHLINKYSEKLGASK